jgi:hypothetical protein
MKKIMKSVWQQITCIKFMLIVISICSISRIYAQEIPSITGKLIDQGSKQAVAYANVSIYKENGMFNITSVPKGKYRLIVNIIGFEPAKRIIEVVNKYNTDAGTIVLQGRDIMLTESVVVGERMKAKSEKDKTTFFITTKMLDASNKGTDILRLLPGIQIDMMQNISLEGSQNILIFVDGKERDRSFISQLNPKQIDKVEIISAPSSNYDANITGAINIILKKERDFGINGQIYVEIPTSNSEIYIFPTYSLNWGFKKLNLYTSYNGEMSYFDIHESTYRKILKSSEIDEIISNQYLRQKDWSHKFHYGFDYFLSPRDQFNFYAFYNPYSREFDGYTNLQRAGIINNLWQARKEDTDINARTFYSLYYKHIFNKNGREITLDVSNSNLKSENTTEYIYNEYATDSATHTNTTKPIQKSISAKIDFTTPIWNKLDLSTGVKVKVQELQDNYSKDFHYNEKILAAYAILAYKNSRYYLSMGLRGEKSVSKLKNSYSNSVLCLLPYATFRYKLSDSQNIQLSFSRSVNRPTMYQLNPFASIEDPYTIRKGNQLLKPELHGSIYLEYSLKFKTNYISSRLFYNKTSDVINSLTFINDTSAFETQVHNMGKIYQSGIQFLGSLRFGIATLNPYVRLSDVYTVCNYISKKYGIENKHSLVFESGLSAIISFKHDLAFSLSFQYASPKNNIQGNSFSDALYLLSVEKTLKQKIKIGITSGLPFAKSFTYQGSEISDGNFYSHNEGNIKMSTFPIWFKLSYQIKSGKNRDKINRAKEEIDNLPKKGF